MTKEAQSENFRQSQTNILKKKILAPEDLPKLTVNESDKINDKMSLPRKELPDESSTKREESMPSNKKHKFAINMKPENMHMNPSPPRRSGDSDLSS